MAARRPDLLPVQDGRPLGIDENVGELLDVARIAHRTGRRAVLARLRNDGLGDVDLAVEHVARNLQVRWPRSAAECGTRRHGDHVRNALGAGNRRGEFGDGSHQLDVRQVLQRSHLVLRQSALAADVQDRALRAKGGGDAGHGIRTARTGGRDDAAELARLARIAVGRMRGDLLVAHVDDADALVDAAVIDVDDVAAAQRKDRVDAFVLQRLGDQVTAGRHARVAAFLLQGIFGGR